MSRITHTSAIQPLAVAAILTVAALATPTASHAQTAQAERALLNHMAVPFTVAASTGGAVTGERALLARIPAGDSVVLLARADSFAVAPVDGRRALIGRP